MKNRNRYFKVVKEFNHFFSFEVKYYFFDGEILWRVYDYGTFKSSFCINLVLSGVKRGELIEIPLAEVALID